MKVTIGGNRLGAGKKMTTDLHNYERSTHDLGFLWRSTMAAGTLVPFLNEVALPGDTFDIELDAKCLTHPTIGPLFGSFKVQLDVFLTPIRIYQAIAHNNSVKIGLDMSKMKLPTMVFRANPVSEEITDLDNSQINPSSLLAYLGLRGIGITNVTSTARTFNATSVLNYYDIAKNYYWNKQEDIGAVIHTPAATIISTIDEISFNNIDNTGPFILSETTPPNLSPVTVDSYNNVITINYTSTAPKPEQVIINSTIGELSLLDLMIGGNYSDNGTNTITSTYDFMRYGTITLFNWRYTTTQDPNYGKPAIATFDLNNIDLMKKAILAHWEEGVSFDIETPGLYPYSWIMEETNGKLNALSSQEGLALKTYQSDIFNNWMKTEWFDDSVTGINAITAIDTSGGSFTIDTLIMAKKLFNVLNRIAISDGTYDSWLDTVWMEERYRRAESPMYMGGLSKELIFQEVISNSQSADQPLGTLAGQGRMGDKHKGGRITIKADEPSYIMGIVSLTPRIDYSQGNRWDLGLESMNDFHKPELSEIGFQDLIQEQMAWWTTNWDGTKWVQESAGKQPAWINYQTNFNRTYGNFAVATNEMFMTLNRRYQFNGLPNDFPHNIQDLTTYIDPSNYNFIFAQTSLDAQNFWMQIACDITARRKMSAKVMPNL